MSTYYTFRCPNCAEQGGFFSRQAWGWGNANLFDNFKFVVAHVDCGNILQVLNEHDDDYGDVNEELAWLERLDSDEYLRDSVWPHAAEWKDVSESWEGAHAKWRAALPERLADARHDAKVGSDAA